MKSIYYLLTIILLLFVSCEKHIDTIENLYFCNNFDKDITIKLFNNSEILKYQLKPNDTIYWNTIVSEYTKSQQKKTNITHYHHPTYEYNKYLNEFDSATISYDSFIYTFSKNIPYNEIDTTNATIEEVLYRDSIYNYIYDSIYKYNKPILHIIYAFPQKKHMKDKSTCSNNKESSNSYHTYDHQYFQYIENKIKKLFVLGKIN